MSGWDGWPTSQKLILSGEHKSAHNPSHWDLEEFHFLSWAAVPLCVRPHSSSSLIAVMWGVGRVVGTGGEVSLLKHRTACANLHALSLHAEGCILNTMGTCGAQSRVREEINLGLFLHENEKMKRYMLLLLLVWFQMLKSVMWWQTWYKQESLCSMWKCQCESFVFLKSLVSPKAVFRGRDGLLGQILQTAVKVGKHTVNMTH